MDAHQQLHARLKGTHRYTGVGGLMLVEIDAIPLPLNGKLDYG